MIDYLSKLTFIFLNNMLFLQMMHEIVSSSERLLMSDRLNSCYGYKEFWQSLASALGPSTEHATGSIYPTTSLFIIYMQWHQKQIERGARLIRYLDKKS